MLDPVVTGARLRTCHHVATVVASTVSSVLLHLFRNSMPRLLVKAVYRVGVATCHVKCTSCDIKGVDFLEQWFCVIRCDVSPRSAAKSELNGVMGDKCTCRSLLPRGRTPELLRGTAGSLYYT